MPLSHGVTAACEWPRGPHTVVGSASPALTQQANDATVSRGQLPASWHPFLSKHSCSVTPGACCCFSRHWCFFEQAGVRAAEGRGSWSTPVPSWVHFSQLTLLGPAPAHHHLSTSSHLQWCKKREVSAKNCSQNPALLGSLRAALEIAPGVNQ